MSEEQKQDKKVDAGAKQCNEKPQTARGYFSKHENILPPLKKTSKDVKSSKEQIFDNELTQMERNLLNLSEMPVE